MQERLKKYSYTCYKKNVKDKKQGGKMKNLRGNRHTILNRGVIRLTDI